LLAEDSDDDEDVFGGEDDAVDVDMNDEEEEIEVEAVPREPQEQRKPEAKTPARGRISARKMHKRRKPGQSIFQHNYGSKKGAKKKKKKTAKPQGIDHQTKKDEQFEINVQPLSRPAPANDFLLEYGACSVIIIYIIVFLNGWRTNENIARAWHMEFDQLIEQEFSYVGVQAGHGTDNDLVKESMNCYNLYATGRESCKGIIYTLNLNMRQDLVSVIWNTMNPSARDHVIIEVPIADTVANFVLLVSKKKSAKQKRAASHDLAANRRVKQVSTGNLPTSLVAFSDCPETIIKLLSSKKRIAAVDNPLFQWLHVTDDASESERRLARSRKCLQLKFNLPSSSEMHKLLPLMKLAFELIDALTNLRLSDLGKKRTAAIRKQLNELVQKSKHAERQELIQRKKLERIQREKQRYENMTPKQKLKADAQEEKRKRRKAMKRAKGKIRIAQH